MHVAEAYGIVFLERLQVAHQTLHCPCELFFASHNNCLYIPYLPYLYLLNRKNKIAANPKHVAPVQRFRNSFHVTFLFQSDKAKPLAPIEHEHATAVLPRLHAVYFVHSSRVCCNFVVAGREIVYRHHTAQTSGVIVVKQHGQRTAARLSNVAQTIIWIHHLIPLCVDLIVRELVKA